MFKEVGGQQVFVWLFAIIEQCRKVKICGAFYDVELV